jgi:hypothetical protein
MDEFLVLPFHLVLWYSTPILDKAYDVSVGPVLVVNVASFNSHRSFASSYPQDPITSSADGSRVFTPCLRVLIEYLSKQVRREYDK